MKQFIKRYGFQIVAVVVGLTIGVVFGLSATSRVYSRQNGVLVKNNSGFDQEVVTNKQALNTWLLHLAKEFQLRHV